LGAPAKVWTKPIEMKNTQDRGAKRAE